MFKKSNRIYYLIILGNLIPLVGYTAFDWSLTESFMFYAVELCAYELVMLPRIVIFVFNSDEYHGSVFSKIVKSFLWLFYHLFLFVMAIWYLVYTAYAVSAGRAEVTRNDILLFIKDNYLVIGFIFFEYIYLFYISYIRIKEYKLLPSSMYLTEIGVFYILLIVIIGMIDGVSVLLEMAISVYQLIILILLIGIKAFVQLLLKKRKDKLLVLQRNGTDKVA